VKALYQDFPDAALQENWQCDRSALLESLAIYGKANGMQVKPAQAEKFSDLELINLLAVSLPFHPAEKQALLEAHELQDREKILVDLLRLGAGSIDDDLEKPPRTLN
jgi:uncharacterized protein